MEDIKSGFQMDGMNKIKELFVKMSESSGCNLDQYIDGKSLTIPNGVSEELLHSIKDFLREMREAVKGTEDIRNLIAEIQNGAGNGKFLEWLEGYLYDSVRPYQDAVYLREADLEKFGQLSSYVFENMILANISNAYIDTEIAPEKSILCTKRILMTFVDRIICHNDRKEYIFDSMERRFGLCAEKCEIWWNLVKNNEDRLWKIMIMKRMFLMENKLNQLLEFIQE